VVGRSRVPTEEITPVYAAGACQIDLARRELRVRDSPVPIGGRALEILEILARSAGDLVTKDELVRRIWPGAIVTENRLQVHAMAIRKALGPYRNLLKTESGRGYRLLGDWTVRRRDAAQPPVGLQRMPAGESPVTNFPATLTRLIGRSTAVAQLRDLISAYRLVSLTGTGGIGKTALALTVARGVVGEYVDGAWLVELASLSDPALVPAAVASVLRPGVRPDMGTLDAITRAIGDKKLLLVLDNCEHLIAAVASLAETLIASCPHVTIVATSREALRIQGEHVWRVSPLEVPATGQRDPAGILHHSAVELFIAKAGDFGADSASNANHAQEIAGICRHLDGIPLAIEFAAARMATLGIELVASGLNDRFALLTSGRRTALPRHRTLRAALDWSYDLLAEEERALLCHLAAFPAGFTLDGAVAVSGESESAVIDGIASLVEKSLVAVDMSAAGSRWRLLETIRSYALGRLAERGAADVAARRHAAYFRNLLASAVPDFRLQLPAEAICRFNQEIDNVRAAIDWSFSPSGDATIGIDVTAAYAPVWMNLSLVAECCARCDHALYRLHMVSNSNPRLGMQLQLSLGTSLVHTSGPTQRAQGFLMRALETAEILGDLGGQARALFLLSGVCRYLGEYGEALAATERLRQVAQQIGDPSIGVIADRLMGNTLMSTGRIFAARRCLERVIESVVHAEGQRLSLWQRRSTELARARAMLARAFWLQGFPERAMAEAQAGLDEAADRQLTVCQVLYFGVCRIAPMTGDFAAAERAIAGLIEAATSLNSRFWMTAAQFLEGKLKVALGAFADGLAVLRAAFATCSDTGWRLSHPEFSGSLAAALGGLGQLDQARNVVSEALASAGGREDGQRWYAPELLRIKAEILLRQSADQSALAEDCLEQAATMAREQGALTWELRVALTLARLRAAQDRRDEARQILAPVYDRFIEGFDTSDLIAAKQMLSELSHAER
jgi:predicted ATPase/DNA-binding winged helix-turn-helix (wHTH) protein